MMDNLMEFFSWAWSGIPIFSWSALSLYLEINLLLIIGWAVWVAVKKLFEWVKIEISNEKLLFTTRLFFLSLVISPFLVSQLSLNLFEEIGLGSVSSGIPGLPSVLRYPDKLVSIEISLSFLGVVSESNQAGFFSNTSLLTSSLMEQSSTILEGFQFDWWAGILSFLCIGLFIQIIRFGMNIVKLHNLIQNSFLWRRVGKIHIFISDEISIPFSTRILGKKQIVLPSSLLSSTTNLRMAIAHEGQHHRNGDLVWTIFTEVIKVICYWNPTTYLWKNDFNQLQEFACDEILIKRQNISSYQYGSCLLKVATWASSGRPSAPQPSFSGIAHMGMSSLFHRNQSSLLKRRIQMLVNQKLIKNSRLRVWGMSSIFLISAFFFALMINGSFDFPSRVLAKTSDTAKLREVQNHVLQVIGDTSVRIKAEKFVILNDLKSIDDLKVAFNQSKGITRLIVLLSPT